MTRRSIRRRPHAPRLAARLLVAAMTAALVLAGCAMSNDTAQLSPAVAPLPEAPGHVYAATTPTLKRMIARAVTELHWAVASVSDEVTALAVEVWTPADQQVLIRTRQLDVDRSRVQVRVGRFGNPDAEQAFHDALARELERWRAEQAESRTGRP